MASENGARRRLAAQNGAVRALVHAETSAEAVESLLREVCENLGWSAGLFWSSSPGQSTLRCRAAWASSDAGISAFIAESKRTVLAPGEGLPGRVVASDEPAWITDVVEDDAFPRRESARAAGLHGGFSVPVPLESDRRGALEFFTTETVDPDRELLETVTATGGYLGQFLRRRRAESRLRFQARLLDAVGEAVMATDPGGRIMYWNAAAESLYGWSADEVLGRNVEEITPTAGSREQAREIMERLLEAEGWSGEFLVRDKAGREFPALVHTSPILDEDGRLMGVIGTSTDITDQKRREEGQWFLSEASRVLSSSLDFSTTLRSVATLAVPHLGDWCLVHVRTGPDGPLTPVARVVPPGHEDAADALDDLLIAEAGPLAAVLEGAASLTAPSGDGPPALDDDRLGEVGVHGVLLVPLRARGTTVGAMTFVLAGTERRYDDAEVELAEELGRRAGVAIDNARLYREAQEGNRAKADFLAVVSHELRTPLNAIAGYADLLAGGVTGELTEAQRRQVGRIKVGAGHLAQLIDEVLTFARVETGRDSLILEPTDLAALSREVAAVVEADARDKGLELTLDLPPEPVVVRTDLRKVRQVLVNLVGNAVKYTEHGSVCLTLRPAGEGAVVQVRDTGVGIEPEARDRIFEPFWQAESPNTRSVGGTGLGLSVSRRLTEMLDGTLEVESEVGAGSTFTLRIPHLDDDAGPESPG